MQKNFRPVAVPLFTSDPYLSIWSFADRLTDDHTRHWTGHRQSMCGILSIDGVPYRFMGKSNVTDTYVPEGKALEQTSLEITPTASIYTFSHPACELKVTFLSTLLMDRLELLSRPVCYLFYEIKPLEEGHSFEVYVDASAELAGDALGQDFKAGQEEGHAWLGNAEQKVLGQDGDDVRIDWGYLHLVHENAEVSTFFKRHQFFLKRKKPKRLEFDPAVPLPFKKFPILFATSEKLSDVFVFAYDDIKSILFYGDRQIDAYYKKFYGSFEKMLPIAVSEADEMRKLCAEFDKKMIADMEKISPEYADIGALAYRQAIAAHKLIEVDGKLQFLSKECFSNGCLATLDVTYPSIPLFLLYNPELVRAMMRPLFTFARDERWQYPFAPHDCGRYPFCDGQRYGLQADGSLLETKQMPVEECGNAILTVAAALRADGNCELLYDNADLLKKWADYLVVYGYDPENQLCTDDFAGHLARNCNLSLKAIVALGAYAQMTGDVRYGEIAKDMADRWIKDAKKQDGKGWRLTFDHDDTWSMKYNIIWDKLLGLNLFDASVYEEEVEVYLSKMNDYGVPLDSRDTYTKLDWMAWTTVMTDRKDYTEAVYKSIARTISETEDRVPITDWYYTDDARQASFQARSVLGGFYINLLAKSWK